MPPKKGGEGLTPDPSEKLEDPSLDQALSEDTVEFGSSERMALPEDEDSILFQFEESLDLARFYLEGEDASSRPGLEAETLRLAPYAQPTGRGVSDALDFRSRALVFLRERILLGLDSDAKRRSRVRPHPFVEDLKQLYQKGRKLKSLILRAKHAEAINVGEEGTLESLAELSFDDLSGVEGLMEEKFTLFVENFRCAVSRVRELELAMKREAALQKDDTWIKTLEDPFDPSVGIGTIASASGEINLLEKEFEIMERISSLADPAPKRLTGKKQFLTCENYSNVSIFAKGAFGSVYSAEVVDRKGEVVLKKVFNNKLLAEKKARRDRVIARIRELNQLFEDKEPRLQYLEEMSEKLADSDTSKAEKAQVTMDELFVELPRLQGEVAKIKKELAELEDPLKMFGEDYDRMLAFAQATVEEFRVSRMLQGVPAFLLHHRRLEVLDPIDSFGFEEGDVFYESEFVDGQDSYKYFDERREEMDSAAFRDEVLSLVYQSADALHQAHGRGVVHCDVKPENILAVSGAKGLKPKICDLGSAVDLARSNTVRSLSLTYSPPEAITEPHEELAEVNPSYDVYALGVALYVYLTGDKDPFDFDKERELRDRKVKAVSSYASMPDIMRRKAKEHKREIKNQPLLEKLDEAGVKGPLVTIIERATHFDPAERYTSMEALMADLKKLIDRPITQRRRREDTDRQAKIEAGIRQRRAEIDRRNRDTGPVLFPTSEELTSERRPLSMGEVLGRLKSMDRVSKEVDKFEERIEEGVRVREIVFSQEEFRYEIIGKEGPTGLGWVWTLTVFEAKSTDTIPGIEDRIFLRRMFDSSI